MILETWDEVPIIHFASLAFKDFIYLFMRHTQREREREAETQEEGEAGSMQGAQCGTQSQVPRITPWAAGGTKPLGHRGCPLVQVLKTVLDTGETF